VILGVILLRDDIPNDVRVFLWTSWYNHHHGGIVVAGTATLIDDVDEEVPEKVTAATGAVVEVVVRN
jgi:hypothetical protein